jgi:Domain of unknown function (DUF1905)/Bacteriocin-protection, YdeI or OmpD-Associated
VIESAGGGGAFVTVPFDVERAYGKKRVKVTVTIDGEPYRGSMVRMGGPRHMVPVLKHIRHAIGKGPGDRVSIAVREDLEPRTISVPRDLATKLGGQTKARLFFKGLSFTNQREYVRWIEAAKREETRARRILRTLRMLKQGRREPHGPAAGPRSTAPSRTAS